MNKFTCSEHFTFEHDHSGLISNEISLKLRCLDGGTNKYFAIRCQRFQAHSLLPSCHMIKIHMQRKLYNSNRYEI